MGTVLDPSRLVQKLQELSGQGQTRVMLLQVAADEMRALGEPYSGVYMYMLHGETLILEAFSGLTTEHTAIQVGKGVCGRAVAEKKDQNVADVTERTEYIACNGTTRSELVVLIRKGDEIIGQIDVDCNIVGGFSIEEHKAVKDVANALGELL